MNRKIIAQFISEKNRIKNVKNHYTENTAKCLMRNIF